MLRALPRRGWCDPSKAQPEEGGLAGGTEMTGARKGGENVCVAPADLPPSPLLASLGHCQFFNVPRALSVFCLGFLHSLIAWPGMVSPQPPGYPVVP